MEQFYSLLCCWKGDSFDESKLDIVANLPLEIALMILRMLNPQSLIAALLVNRKWLRIVRCDTVLRDTVRTELGRQRQEKWNMYYGRPASSRTQTGRDPTRNHLMFSKISNKAPNANSAQQERQVVDQQSHARVGLAMLNAQNDRTEPVIPSGGQGLRGLIAEKSMPHVLKSTYAHPHNLHAVQPKISGYSQNRPRPYTLQRAKEGCRQLVSNVKPTINKMRTRSLRL